MKNSGFPQAKNPQKARHSSKDHRCPACGNKNIRRTGRQGWLEKFCSIFGFYPFRCTNYECNHRFLRLAKS